MQIKAKILALAFVALGLFASCSFDGQSEAECRVFDVSGCKQKTDLTKGNTDLSSASYHWLMNGNLEINRNNVMTDCKSGEWNVEVKVKEGEIRLTEHLFGEKADCGCIRDLRYEISDIPSGDYEIMIDGKKFGGVRIY